ncbi:MAG: acyl-ACP--UDP-N-acetylglucosamine O-acyltransferase [Alphaproteobacteria bacterium]|nr:acyl-ACP--UDP-N-acetylglucosamine O-acyltransferase [Alphaproteobacteria bacterium]
MSIHPTAMIHPKAVIGKNVQIGAYCVVGEHVKLDDEVILHSHVVVEGDTHIGRATEIFPFAVIGHCPQDKKFSGELTKLEIGTDNKIREHVTMHPGTQGGGGITKIGSHCLFMVGAHVAHDCYVGDHVILANNATLAGHVLVGNGVIVGGLSAIHQFVRIGDFAFIGGMSGVEKDVIPYGTVKGERASLDGLNLVGLKRRNIDREHIHALRHAFKEIFAGSSGTLVERANNLKAKYTQPEARALIEFILADTSRSICTPNERDTLTESDAA